MTSDPTEPAALFRLEGTLCRRPTLTTAGWLTANAQRVRARLFGLSTLALATPLAANPFLADPARARALAWSALKGMSEDRLLILGELYAEQFLTPSIPTVGRDLLARCRARRQRVVLLSDNIEAVVRPFAEALGIDEYLCNRLELRNRFVTGTMIEPVLKSEIAGRPLKDLLEERGIELSQAAAYGSNIADSVLLGAVSLPCAVEPDRRLRRMARDLDWPVVEG